MLANNKTLHGSSKPTHNSVQARIGDHILPENKEDCYQTLHYACRCPSVTLHHFGEIDRQDGSYLVLKPDTCWIYKHPHDPVCADGSHLRTKLCMNGLNITAKSMATD